MGMPREISREEVCVKDCEPRKVHDGVLRREEYHFHRADPLFQDHFPGRPVIPGSLLVSCFHKTAIRWLADAPSSSAWTLREVINSRFVAFGEPGRVEVRMYGLSRREGDILLEFSALQNGRPLAHARLRYGPS